MECELDVNGHREPNHADGEIIHDPDRLNHMYVAARELPFSKLSIEKVARQLIEVFSGL